ncbi:MAG: phosphoribosylglycinamide formyltransferase [Acidiferrobacter sp.]
MNDPLRVAVVISGRGSNLRALHLAAHPSTYAIVGVISDKPTAQGLTYARQCRLPTTVVDPHDYPDTGQFERALAHAIDDVRPDIVALAGFLRILSAAFVDRFHGRLINIHPSLLPAFPGLDTHRRALAAGATEHGATVHYVTPQVDGGPIIAQSRLVVEAGEDPTQLAKRVLALEHTLYPQVLTALARARHAPPPTPPS